jgi:hypothetical protein
MTDYHTVYKGNEGETTEWDDIQRKQGNFPDKVRIFSPSKSPQPHSFTHPSFNRYAGTYLET